MKKLDLLIIKWIMKLEEWINIFRDIEPKFMSFFK